MPFDVLSDVTVTAVDETSWRVEKALLYHGEADIFVVPQGYITDFATVPRVAVWLIPKFGRYTRAAILHDWLITDKLPKGDICSLDVDGLFRRVMREEGVPFVRRWLMWAGVRWGALFNSHRRKGWFTPAPALTCIGISVLALPVVLPAGVGIGFGLIIYSVAELIATRGRRAGDLST